MLAVHDERGSDVTLASHPETHRLALGELVVEGNRVIDYREKPEKRFLIRGALRGHLEGADRI